MQTLANKSDCICAACGGRGAALSNTINEYEHGNMDGTTFQQLYVLIKKENIPLFCVRCAKQFHCEYEDILVEKDDNGCDSYCACCSCRGQEPEFFMDRKCSGNCHEVVKPFSDKQIIGFIERMQAHVESRRERGQLIRRCEANDWCRYFAVRVHEDGTALCGRHDNQKRKKENRYPALMPSALVKAVTAFRNNAVESASTRTRKWETSKGEIKYAHIMDYILHDGKRHVVHLDDEAISEELMKLFDARKNHISSISIKYIKALSRNQIPKTISDLDLMKWKAAYDALRELGIKF